jgi:hypothetical protein
MRKLHGLLLWVGLALAVPFAQAETPPARSKPFIIAVDVEGFGYRYSSRVFTEAFRRLGIPVVIEVYPLARRAALVAEGYIDGEAARVFSYADTHPELVRVEESIMDFRFSVFTANPALRARNIEDLPATAMVEFRRGIMVCENALKKAIPPERLSTVVATEQGIKKLLAARTDAYCDIDTFFYEALRSGDMQDAGRVRKLFEIASLPTYPHLYRKHADLAPRLAATMKKMKDEGLLDRYRDEAERGTTGPR